MSTYDAVEYLDTWAKTGRYPSIHNGMVDLVRACVSPDEGTVLDLGSSTGLLGQRLRKAGFQVLAIEADERAITHGIRAGAYVGVGVRRWELSPNDMEELSDWLDDNEVSIVVARRVLPELLNHDVTPKALGLAMLEGGVKHLFLEGRQVRTNSKHMLSSLFEEIAQLPAEWRTTTTVGSALAHLVC